MKDLVRYRAMESLCRQRAVFHPLESWRLLAEAEMWHHKAQAEVASGLAGCHDVAPGVFPGSALAPKIPVETDGRNQLLAG